MKVLYSVNINIELPSINGAVHWKYEFIFSAGKDLNMRKKLHHINALMKI